MSHTVGQITEDNQKSPGSQDSFPLEDKTDSDVSLLSDADYEFLFNQLLEGVSHGWHDRRIIKFFTQLGDRGQQENWVAWLERLRSKIITLPLQSKRHLGTVMVRLGELTQSNPDIGKIGTVSNRIGRELLFGNTENVVWEYVGPDLIVDAPVKELETEETFSERLPEEFVDLGYAAVRDRVITDAPIAESRLEEELILESPAEKSIKEDCATKMADRSISGLEEEEIFALDLEALEDFPQQLPGDNLSSESIEDKPAQSMLDELTVKLSSEKAMPTTSSAISSSEFESASTFDDDFEFELDSSESELTTEDLISEKSSPSQQRELSSIVESADSLSSMLDLEVDNSTSPETSDLDSVSVSAEQVMSLIREDDKLATEISRKLNVSSEDNNNSDLSAPVDLDRSSVDLIEGWFNLGLKQVSGGEFDKAIASWEKALNINPNLSEAWHNRGSALGRLGKYSEAVESFQKALTIDPDNYQAWNDLAHALYQLQNWAAAADSWSNAIKIIPANHLFWYNRGCALEQLESWAESISSYEKSLEIKPDFQPARSRYTNLIADNSRSN